MRRFVVVASLALALLLAGCGQSADQAVQNATGIKVDSNGNSATITGSNGDTLTINSNIATELKDFPVPDGFKSEGGGTMGAGGSAMSVASWKGQGEVKNIVEFYKQKMPSSGWSEDGMMMDMGDSALLNYKKGDFSVTITVSKESDGTTIAVLGGKDSATPQATTSTVKTATPTNKSEATPTAKSTKSQATPTPEKPTLTDASSLPDELKDLPVPSGFGVVKGSTSRLVQGGKLLMATATWFGTGTIKNAADFYAKNMVSKGWTEEANLVSDDSAILSYTITKGSDKYTVAIGIDTTDAGIEVSVSMGAGQ